MVVNTHFRMTFMKLKEMGGETINLLDLCMSIGYSSELKWQLCPLV